MNSGKQGFLYGKKPGKAHIGSVHVLMELVNTLGVNHWTNEHKGRSSMEKSEWSVLVWTLGELVEI